jgi:iron complex transport system substrate-binding protein
MKLLRFFAVLALTGITGLTACSQISTTSTTAATSSTTANGVISVTDDIGRTVVIKGGVHRIISLSPSNTEIVYALGLQDELAGVTSYDDYPADAQTKTVVSDYSTVDMEKIVNAQPDLVLADAIQQHDTVPALEQLGINVYVMTPDTMDKIYNDLKTLGEFAGKNAEANALVANLTARTQVVGAKTASLTDTQKPRVLYVTWHDPIWTAGSDTMIQYLITQAGGTNIAGDLNGYATITMESVVQRNPQIIIVMSSMGTDHVSMDYIKTNPQFAATDAVKNGQVYEVDADIFGRTTPRIVDGLETLAKLLHPELFK